MLRLFNTMSREVEEFKPIKKGQVTFYSCGPTVYDFAHIGNLRTYIFIDILKRALLFDGFNVKHVMNITDVGHLTSDNDVGEDKVERSARLESKSAREIANFYTAAFKGDLRKLNILEPDIWCKATEHIAEQIELIKILEQKGFIYKISDGLYFDTAKFFDYGKLARLNLAGQEEGARVEINREKKNPTDFAVWKFSTPSFVSPFARERLSGGKRQQEWDSPWGVGFPGWHIECSAMAMKYLGKTMDIHTGGIDHIPVHHTNEIAQSEAATGKQFAKFWLHAEFLLINESRMGKSENNFIILQTLIEKGYEPMAYRFFCLTAHYRSKLNFSWEALENAQHAWTKFKTKFLDFGRQKGKADKKYLTKFSAFVEEDLSMPQALALAWEVMNDREMLDADKRQTLLEFDRVFGFNLENAAEEKLEIPADVTALVEEREEARLNKKWEKADELRKKINELGWEIEDTVDSRKLKKRKE